MSTQLVDTITTADNFTLSFLYEARDDYSPTIIICHGITADKHEGGFFDDIASAMLNRGFSVLRFDYRGHGASSGTSLDVTLSGETIDAQAVYAWLKAHKAKTKIYGIIAASFCCRSVIELALKSPPNALVLLNPVFDYRRTFIEPETLWGKEILAEHARADLPAGAYTVIPGSKFYLSDHLWKEMETDGTPALARGLSCPAIAFHGDEDTKVPIAPLLEFSRQHPKIIDLVVKRGEGHGLKGNRPELIDQLGNWMERRLLS